jgi:hypothetical protein
MKWQKKGLIYVADGNVAWAKSHAMIPTPNFLSEDILRLYLTFCDAKGIGRIGYVDVAADNPAHVLRVSKNPVLDIGEAGTFDENGVLATSIVDAPDGKKYLYYVGFELGTQIRYRLLSGIAISHDQGETFQRIQKTPALERSNEELYFRCGPHVIYEEDIFKMWYVAGSQWLTLHNKTMPVYNIKYLESKDGIQWDKAGHPCLDIDDKVEHGFGRPYVYQENNLYKMFYSIRTNSAGYRIGYAESSDKGRTWLRKDALAGIDVSPQGFDDSTVCYSAVVKNKNKSYLFYNGNDFGRTGFGYAELEN